MIIKFVESGFIPDQHITDRTQMKNCVHVLAEHGYDLNIAAFPAYPTQELFELDVDVIVYYHAFSELYKRATQESLLELRSILESGAYCDYDESLPLGLLSLHAEQSEERLIKLDLWFAFSELGLNIFPVADDDDSSDSEAKEGFYEAEGNQNLF